MMFFPTLRFFTGPFPPGAFAARFFAAVIRPPLLAFAILEFPPSRSWCCRMLTGVEAGAFSRFD
jgi:hypothetical protein